MKKSTSLEGVVLRFDSRASSHEGYSVETRQNHHLHRQNHCQNHPLFSSSFVSPLPQVDQQSYCDSIPQVSFLLLLATTIDHPRQIGPSWEFDLVVLRRKRVKFLVLGSSKGEDEKEGMRFGFRGRAEDRIKRKMRAHTHLNVQRTKWE
ncbi:hypothetical protein CRG98_000546 [Punica granatum]|uniref:Uncharacterized protein n=1 Tax=Punica granatum TaxID=22663 RepID=A0A2I0LEF6_PUNGR|nr:hypothetical protein CRG98_000546 [Punica granatum]